MTYKETIEYIHSLENFGLPPGLDRIKTVLKALGNPQKGLKAIHIAGTNGKGSVGAMLAQIYKEAGLKTGLFISPYIINFRERIQICGEYISESDLSDYALRVIATKITLTQFEFITALAFLYFKEKRTDILICETGLGGRLDATNALSTKLAAVITKIGLDHTAVLGDSIEKITAEKCGIIDNCPVITNPCQKNSALRVIKQYSENVIIPDIFQLEKIGEDTYIYKGDKYSLSLKGDFQAENALTVIETVKTVSPEISYDIIYKGIGNTFFPARMEVISKKPLVVLDGAHNPDGAVALAKELEKYNGKFTAIVGMMRDKDCEDFLKTTLKFCKYCIAVEVDDIPRSLKSSDLYDFACKYCDCFIADDYISAIKKADEISGENPVFIFGSLYLASAIRDDLKEFYK